MNNTGILRRTSIPIRLGGLAIGGDAPVSVQSMTNTPTADVRATVQQIRALASAGCEIVRLAVPDDEAAAALPEIRKAVRLPLVADVHFDHILALAAIEAGFDGLRLNPGNISSPGKVTEVVRAALERGIPIRVGVNSGSLAKDLLNKHGVCAFSLVESALRHVNLLEKNGFDQIKISVKASSVPLMIESYRLLAEKTAYPLHLGVTEAGTEYEGVVRSSVGIGTLLAEGIGDTIRVSLTADPVLEVNAAYSILRALSLRPGLRIVSCPTCGRTRVNLIELARKVEVALTPYRDLPMTVAVMGCVVNGPGEAREADFGIAGGIGEGVLFRHGEPVGKLPEDQLVGALIELITQEAETFRA